MKRTDIHRILLIGSGPIVIGQACEFDYSGTQALKALKEEGYEVVLVNSNPATIMTDPTLADRTYIEPLTVEFLERIIQKERPDALLPTMGGQTALNLSVELAEKGILEKCGVQLIGASLEAIKKAEDRQLFKETMAGIGLDMPKSRIAASLAEAEGAVADFGFPIILRPSFTLGGLGGGIAYNLEELREKVALALDLSPTHQVLVEESVIGWKEYELEVMRDRKDNVVVVCSIENVDPMGVHTGDSVTVAPAQTLTDSQYQILRDQAQAAMRAIGVDTGGSNVQFGVDPKTGRTVVIEVNPRVSRSSALASKATGFPIAKIAAKLAVGYTLDEIPNDITKKTPASFEPAIDYVVTKVPRFNFEKFGVVDARLNTSMKSVGEVMAMGRTFKESLQKAFRGLEIKRSGLESTPLERDQAPEELERLLAFPNPRRLFYVKAALENGLSVTEIAELSSIDPWFIAQINELVTFEKALKGVKPSREILLEAKRLGFSDAQLGAAFGKSEAALRRLRKAAKVLPTYKRVDTCAAEFVSSTPYLFSTYEDEDETGAAQRKKKIVILGGGPNRIGQGIEFDYCCVHAVLALKSIGYETVMVNCNPETVSTDYDTADRLYFEPLTLEDVLNIVDKEKPYGVIVQFGGQTPLNLTLPLAKAGVRILGTPPNSIDLAENRERFGKLVHALKIPMPEHATVKTIGEAVKAAARVGYPVMARPSYVLGGRAMEVVYDEEALRRYMERTTASFSGNAILLDRFLTDAVEVDVDAIADGHTVFIAGIMEHIEEAGIHSGDSACSLPPHSLTPYQQSMIASYTRKLAKKLRVKGLLNLQFAIQDGVVYLLEANPRASRTVPFVSKATGLPLAKIAAQVMAGKRLSKLLPKEVFEHVVPPLPYTATKAVVLPFRRFEGVDPRLGPEMKSTGEVMGIDDDFATSFAKSQTAAGSALPAQGTVFLSVRDADKTAVLPIARGLQHLGFSIVATKRTAEFLSSNGVPVQRVFKIGEGKPDIVDLLKQKTVRLVINTPSGKRAASDGFAIRRTALELGVPQITTLYGAKAAMRALEALKSGTRPDVVPLQDHYRRLSYPVPA